MKNIDDPDSLDLEELRYLAQISEQTDRIPEMLRYLKSLASKTLEDLTNEERNMLSFAYQILVGTCRTSWRILASIEKQENSLINKSIVEELKAEIETEIINHCYDLINLIDRDLLHKASSAERRVFYYKMKGDYYRYITEIAKDNFNCSACNGEVF